MICLQPVCQFYVSGSGNGDAIECFGGDADLQFVERYIDTFLEPDVQGVVGYIDV